MSLKEYILVKIKSINDSKLLYELELLINQTKAGSPIETNELDKVYMSTKNRGQATLLKKGMSSRNPETAVNWLEKIANSGILDHLEDPVEWQKNERRNRTLITS